MLSIRKIKHNMLNISSIFRKGIYLYLILPFIIFILGFVKPIYAILILIVTLYLIWIIFHSQCSSIYINRDDFKKIIIVFIIIILWVLLSGIGGQSYQTEDFFWRNGLFQSLVNEKWPIVKDVIFNGELASRGISYYFGFWLPSALIGKIFGLTIANLFQIIWASIGILLVYLGISIKFKKFVIWPFIVFIFFSGMDILGYYLQGTDMSTINQTTHLEWWSIFEFSSHTTQLFWVFNQAIPAWVATIYLILEKENKNFGFIFSSLLISSTLPTVGLIPFCIYYFFSREYNSKKKYSKEWWIIWFKDSFSLCNILSVIFIGIPILLFLLRTESNAIITLYSFRNGGWILYLLFLLIDIGGFCYIIYSGKSMSKLYYLAIIWLAFCPILRGKGLGDNFCMRASIPALFILYIGVIESLQKLFNQKNKLLLATSIIILVIGAKTPINEMIKNISEVRNRNVSEVITSVKADPVSTEQVLTNSLESVNAETSLFYKYLAK